MMTEVEIDGLEVLKLLLHDCVFVFFCFHLRREENGSVNFQVMAHPSVTPWSCEDDTS